MQKYHIIFSFITPDSYQEKKIHILKPEKYILNIRDVDALEYASTDMPDIKLNKKKEARKKNLFFVPSSCFKNIIYSNYLRN